MTRQGGWAYVVLDEDGNTREGHGYLFDTTNNAMELKAAIEGLKSLGTEKHNVYLLSDSAYMVSALQKKWWKEWAKAGWRKGNAKTPNAKLWRELIKLTKYHAVEPVKVKAHSGDYFNDRCDKLAKAARHAAGRYKVVL